MAFYMFSVQIVPRIKIEQKRFKHETLLEHQKEDTEWITEGRTKHNQFFCESKKDGTHLKKLAHLFFNNPFPSWLAAVQDTCL